jgi:hypothetical protein
MIRRNDYTIFSKIDITNMLKEKVNVFMVIDYVPEISCLFIPLFSVFMAGIYYETLNKSIKYRIGRRSDYFKFKRYYRFKFSIVSSLLINLPLLVLLLIVYSYNNSLLIPYSIGDLGELKNYGDSFTFLVEDNIRLLFYSIVVNFLIYSFVCNYFSLISIEKVKDIKILLILIILSIYIVPFIGSNLFNLDSILFIPSENFIWERDYFKGNLLFNLCYPYLLFVLIYFGVHKFSNEDI